jgi:hypothetical protein
MRRFLAHVLLVFVVTLFLLSCDEEEIPAGSLSTPPASIIPLKTGAAWWYNQFSYDSSGNITNTLLDSTGWLVSRETTMSGEKWFFLAGAFAANRGGGFWIHDGSSPYLYFKYPASVGDTWISLSGIQVSLTSTNASVSLQHKTYVCYRYQMRKWGYLIADWLVQPGFGVVSLEAYATPPGGVTYRTYRRELVRYRSS